MEGSGAEGAGFEKTNRAMSWRDPQTGWTGRPFSLSLSWVTDGEMEAQGGRRRREPWVPPDGAEQECVCLCRS